MNIKIDASDPNFKDCEACLWHLAHYRPENLFIFYNRFRDRFCVNPNYGAKEEHNGFHESLLRIKQDQDSAGRA